MYNQTSVPLRKRASGESIRAEDLQNRMEEYKAEAEKKIPRIVRGSRSSSGSRLASAITEQDEQPSRSLPVEPTSPSTPSKPEVSEPEKD